MRTFSPWLAACVLVTSAPAFAEEPAIEQLEARIESLEREAAELRAEIQRLRRAHAVTTPAQGDRAPAVARAQDAGNERDEAAAWDGAYVGVHAGYLRFRTRLNPGTIGERQSTEGASFGAQLGRRWQSGALVTGVELSATFPQAPDHDSSAGLPFPGPVLQLDQRWSGQARANIGLASGRWLGYAIGGLDVTQLRLEVANLVCTASSCALTGPSRSARRTFVGSVLGLGAAVRLGDGYSLGLEATRSSFGRTTHGAFDYVVRDDALTLRLNWQLP